MTELIVGIRHERDDITPQATVGAEMSVIGLLGTAPGADPAVFPLNEPVYLTTSDMARRAALGPAGTLEDALKGISSGLTANSSAAKVVVVRVPEAGTTQGTIANIVGSEALGTGMWALLRAGEDHGVIPRLLVAPGYTSQPSSSLGSVSISNHGSGYTSAPTVAFSGGDGAGAVAEAVLSNGITIAITAAGTGYTTAPTITIESPGPGGVTATATCTVSGGAIDAITVTNPGFGYTTAPTITVTGAGSGAVLTATLTGRVRSINITNPGVGYTSAPTISFTGGGGSGAAATVAVNQYANAICAMMPTIAERLTGMFIPEGPTSGRTAWINWLETLPRSTRILHPLTQVAKDLDSQGNVVNRPLSPYVAGLYVRRDNEFNGRPGHSIANQSMNIVGVSPRIRLDLRDASSEGQDYLLRNAGIVIRGESGVESSLSEGGFVFWGTDTLSPDSGYLFANVARMRDYIELTQMKLLRYFLGRFNITVQTVQAIYNTMDSHLSSLRADRDILDYRLRWEPDQNTPEELRLGFLTVGFQAEEPPVLRRIVVKSRRHREALEDLVQQVSTQLGDVIATNV